MKLSPLISEIAEAADVFLLMLSFRWLIREELLRLLVLSGEKGVTLNLDFLAGLLIYDRIGQLHNFYYRT